MNISDFCSIIAGILIVVNYFDILIKYKKIKKENEELKLSIERMPYEMCLNCDKSE